MRSGYRSVAAVVGHDFGSPVAAWCALVRPDVFRSVALMSAPFEGPPAPDSGRRRAATSMRRWRSCRVRASTISGTTPRAPPTRTCGIASRACTRSCAPTTTTRAPTGGRTSRSACKAGPPRNWRRCRPTTSWISARRWPRRSRMKCRPPRKSPHADGCPTASLRSTAGNTSATASPAACSGIGAARRGSTRRSCNCSPAGRSTCRRCSSPAAATGAPTSGPVRSSACRRARAPAWSAAT